MEEDVLRCESKDEVEKKLDAFDKKITLLRKAALKGMKRFSRNLAAIGYKDGKQTARRAMRKKKIHYPGEGK